MIRILFLMAFSLAQAQNIEKLSSKCDLHVYPDGNSKTKCVKELGTPYVVLKEHNGFVGIRTFDCIGWVAKECAEKKTASSKKDWFQKREPAESREKFFGLGLYAPFSVPFTGTMDSGTGRGINYGGEVSLSFRISHIFRVDLQGGLQYYAVSRTIDGSGSLTDTSATYNQTLGYYTGSLLFYFLMSEDFERKPELLTDEWWVGVGLMAGLPASGYQTSSVSDAVTFTPTDKLGMLVASVTNKMNLGSSLYLWPGFYGYYQLIGASGNLLFGFGLSLALQWQI